MKNDKNTPSEAKTSKPLLFADDRSDAQRFDPRLHRGSLDPSRIPGYSEIVTANDIDKADDLWFREKNLGKTKDQVYREIGASPQVLPVEFQWLPVSGAAGGGISSHQARVLDGMKNQQGFRLATVEDLEREGYGFPPAGRLAEDGTIRRGSDVGLFVRSGEVARMWNSFREDTQASLEGDTSRTATAGAYETDLSFSEEDRETVTVKH